MSTLSLQKFMTGTCRSDSKMHVMHVYKNVNVQKKQPSNRCKIYMLHVMHVLHVKKTYTYIENIYKKICLIRKNIDALRARKIKKPTCMTCKTCNM